MLSMETDKERAAAAQIRSDLGLDELSQRLQEQVLLRDPEELIGIAFKYLDRITTLVAGLVQLEMELQGLDADPEPELASYLAGLHTAKQIIRGEV